MAKKLMRTIALISFLCVLDSFGLAPPAPETLATYSNAAVIVSERMPVMHLQKEPIDDALASDALDLFIDSLDYDHSVFLQSDVDAFRQRSSSLDDDFKEGQLGMAFEVYEAYMQRLSNRIDYVEQLLDAGFDFTTEERHLWKRDDAPYAESESEWNDLWRKKIKNIYIGYKVSDRLDREEGASDDESGVGDPQAEEQTEGDEVNSITVAESPEERILNQYEQLLNVMNDNDAHWLLSLYITSFARALDPHSDFMSQRDIEDFNISMKKSLNGIGALLNTEDGSAKIVRLIPGGPADLDGRLQPNDKIIAVAEEGAEAVDIRHWPLSRSVRLIRGERGSKVVLSVVPASDISGAKVKKIELTRDEVKLEEQIAKGKVRAVENDFGGQYNIGVITIPDFYADMEAQRSGDTEARSVTRDVRSILGGFKATNNVDGVVVDLRNNGGGVLSEAVDLTGLFIDSGPVVQVKTQSWLARKLYDADPEQLYKGPLVVLVNRLSASASEIFAAALQDYNRAIIVGDSKTHGKGTVQALLPLSNSKDELGSLKLTTAGFYRIAGNSTQMAGVQPDIVIPSILDYMEIGEENQPHALELKPIRSAFYWSNDKLEKILPTIRDNSISKRSANVQYGEYVKLLDHLGEQRRSEYISLNMDERLQTARAERRMQDLALKLDLDGLGAAAGEDEEESDENITDLVMEETLKIISDLISLSTSDGEVEPTIAERS